MLHEDEQGAHGPTAEEWGFGNRPAPRPKLFFAKENLGKENGR